MLEGFGLAPLQGDADDTEYLAAGANRKVETARLRQGPRAVSYTHLDVYKRQVFTLSDGENVVATGECVDGHA